MRPGGVEERIIHKARNPTATKLRVHRNEVHIRLIGFRLWKKSDQKPYDLRIVFNNKTGVAEMFEEGNIKEEDFKEMGYPYINLSSIYDLKDRLEAETI